MVEQEFISRKIGYVQLVCTIPNLQNKQKPLFQREFDLHEQI